MSDWPRRRLKDLGLWYGGGTPSKSRLDFWRDGSVPWLSPKDMGAETLSDTQDHITAAAIEKSAAKLVPSGSVAVVVRSGILERRFPVAVVPFATTLNQDMKAIVPADDVHPRWIAWGLRAYERELLGSCRKAGTTVASMEMARLFDFELPVPPLDEQRRIVDIIEEHLSRLDVAVSAALQAQQRVFPLRRRILLDGALGRWVAPRRGVDLPPIASIDWGGNNPPDVLLPHGWAWRKWRELGSSQNGRAFPSAAYSATGVRLLRPGNLGAGGRLTWSPKSTRHLPAKFAEDNGDLLLKQNDLVINLTAQSLKDEFLGRVCVVGADDRALLNQRLARLVPVGVSPKFAALVFRSPVFRSYVGSLNTGSLIQHMFTRQIAEFWLPVPPPGDQELLSSACAERLDALERLEEGLDAVDPKKLVLRDALLNAAFAGRLTGGAHDPEIVGELADV